MRILAVIGRKARRREGDVDVLIGGFGSSRWGYRAMRTSMQQTSGRPTLYIGLGRWDVWRLLRRSDYPRAVHSQALRVTKHLRRKGVTSMRLYGHSFGTAVALVVAVMVAGEIEVKQLVGLSPACTHAPGTWRLIGRFLAQLWDDFCDLLLHQDQHVRRTIRANVLGLFWYLGNIPRSILEGLVIGRHEIFARLYAVMQGYNIPTYVGFSQFDRLFSCTAMADAVHYLPPGHVFMLEGVGHNVQYYRHVAQQLHQHNVL